MEQTPKNLLDALYSIELDYLSVLPEFQKDTDTLMREIEKLMDNNGTIIASRAAYLCTLVHEPSVERLWTQAVQHKISDVRIAFAGGLRNIPAQQARPYIKQLLLDTDPAIIRQALKTWAQFLPSSSVDVDTILSLLSNDRVGEAKQLILENLAVWGLDTSK